MSEFKIIVRDTKKNVTLLKGPFNQYFIVPTPEENNLQYLEFAWGNGGTINTDPIMKTLVEAGILSL